MSIYICHKEHIIQDNGKHTTTTKEVLLEHPFNCSLVNNFFERLCSTYYLLWNATTFPITLT